MASRVRARLVHGITAANGLRCRSEFQTIRDRIRRASGRLAEPVAGSDLRRGRIWLGQPRTRRGRDVGRLIWVPLIERHPATDGL